MPSSFTARSRKSSFANPTTSPGPSGHVPTTFFLASEQQMEDAVAHQPAQSRQSEHTRSDKSDTGVQGGIVADKVQSIEEALSAAFGAGADASRSKPLSRSGSVENKGVDAAGEFGKKRKRKGLGDEIVTTEPLVLSGAETPRHADGSTHSSPQPLYKPATAGGHVRRLSGATVSNPLTPINVDSPAYQLDSGIPSTPKSVSLRSLRLSDDGEHDDFQLNDGASQAVASTDDEDDDGDRDSVRHHHADSVAPEFVMPSIAMPSRRPFTDKGKRLGRLKVLVAGRVGTGKTGLIRSIVQICEHIVHVDPVPVPISSLELSGSSHTAKGANGGDAAASRDASPSTGSLVKPGLEINASTRAYPTWWSDIEESKVLRRRKSMGLGDTILERNMSFIDTPGYDAEEGAEDKIVCYVESLMARSTGLANTSDTEMLHMLSGGGGAQVDAVLFLFGDEISETDLRFCKRLSVLTNIIPLFSRADVLSEETKAQRKRDILQGLSTHDVKPFTFGRFEKSQVPNLNVDGAARSTSAASNQSIAHESQTESQAAATVEQQPESTTEGFAPFAVSSAPGPDHETMDASLLMSSSYCPPPVPSELQDLVQLLFEPENAAWLRHTSARKLVGWRRGQTLRSAGTGKQPASPGTQWKLGLGMPSSASLARTAALRGTHSPRLESAPVPRWAADLRQALRHERARDGLMELPRGEEKKPARARKTKRHWSEGSTTSSQTMQRSERSDIIERVSNVTWSALRLVSIVGAVGVTACVVARRCFGIDSVTVGWDWN